MAHITVVSSATGAAGKSFVSTALADSFTRINGVGRVLLLDLCHPFGTLDAFLSKSEERLFDLGDILDGRCDASSCELDTPIGFRLLPGCIRLDWTLQHDKFKALLYELGDRYDEIIIDCPSYDIQRIKSAFSLRATGIAVTPLSPFSVSLTSRLADMFFSSGAENAFLLINRFHCIKGLPVPNLDDIIDQAGLRLIGIVPQTVFENSESVKNTADAFFRIAQRITGKTVQLPDLYNL